MKLLFLMLMSSHLMASFMIYIGKNEDDISDSWLASDNITYDPSVWF